MVGANHLVTLVNEAADLLARAGVAEPGRVLSPLLHAALDNALRVGDAALTGPVSRGDAGTVAGHLRVLGERAPDAVPGYAAMARLTAGRALAAGRITPTQAAPLVDVLAAAEAPTAAGERAARAAVRAAARRPRGARGRRAAAGRPGRGRPLPEPGPGPVGGGRQPPAPARARRRGGRAGRGHRAAGRAGPRRTRTRRRG